MQTDSQPHNSGVSRRETLAAYTGGSAGLDGFIAHLIYLTLGSRSANPPACIGASSSRRSDKVGRLFAHPHLQYNMTETLG